MNIWTQKSIELANQKNYLDLLYRVYPITENAQREIAEESLESLKRNFASNNNDELISQLTDLTSKKQIVFPIKDSYVAYLRHDKTAIKRNPQTVNRLCSILHEMGIEKLIDKATAPKETNRQIGPLFSEWMKKGSLCNNYTDNEDIFLRSSENILFLSSDNHKADFARKYLGYKRDKGLDFLAKFNNTYIIGEAKFLSDFGGSQNSDFEDAELTLRSELANTKYEVKKIAIIDGVIYINSCAGQKMAKNMRTKFSDNEVILSSLLLRDYLYSL